MPQVNVEWAAYWRGLLQWHENNPADDMCACGDRSRDCRIRKVAVKRGVIPVVTDNVRP